MTNTQTLSASFSSQSNQKTLYNTILSKRLLLQQSKEASQRDIAENLQEGSQYMKEGASKSTGKSTGSASYTRREKASEPHTKIESSLLNLFENLFSSIGKKMLVLVGLMFPKQMLTVIEGVVTGMKHLGIAILNVVDGFLSAREKLNEWGMDASWGNIVKLSAAAWGVNKGARAWQAARAAVGAGGAGGAAGSAAAGAAGSAAAGAAGGAAAGAARANYFTASTAASQPRKSVYERFKIWLMSPKGKAALTKYAPNLVKGNYVKWIAGVVVRSASILWVLFEIGLALTLVWSIVEAFEKDDKNDGGGLTQEEADELNKEYDEVKKAEDERESKVKEIKKERESVQKIRDALRDTDVGAMFAPLHKAYDKAMGVTPDTPSAPMTPGAAAPPAKPTQSATRIVSENKKQAPLTGEQQKEFLRQFREYIATGEAVGSDQWNSKHNDATGKPTVIPGLSEMTLSQALENSKTGPVGRYQFNKDTLASLLKRPHWKNKLNEKFNEENQNKLANELITELAVTQDFFKDPGNDEKREKFQKRNALTWTSLPGGIVPNLDASSNAANGDISRKTWVDYSKAIIKFSGGKAVSQSVSEPTAVASVNPATANTGAQTQAQSENQFKITDAIYEFLKEGAPKPSNTVINNNNISQNSLGIPNPVSAYSEEYYKIVLQRQAIDGFAQLVQ